MDEILKEFSVQAAWSSASEIVVVMRFLEQERDAAMAGARIAMEDRFKVFLQEQMDEEFAMAGNATDPH